MDLKEMMDGSSEPWTEERHSSFLNWVEESFIRRVLARSTACSGEGDADWFPLPLDRFIPDSATESTRDLGRVVQQRRCPAEDDAARSHGKGRSRRWEAAVTAEDDTDAESDVTIRGRSRRKRQLLCSTANAAVLRQLGRAKPAGTMSHKSNAAETGASTSAYGGWLGSSYQEASMAESTRFDLDQNKGMLVGDN